jgi:hypothetical protein
MAFDEELAARVRRQLEGRRVFEERPMFGGLAFMINGHMACGIMKNQLMVRVGPESYDAALRLPNAGQMEFTGKPMRGFVVVDPEGLSTPKRLGDWVNRGLSFVDSLPPK